MSGSACIVLAAGIGTRMKSGRPKVMHAVAGRPMLAHVLEALSAIAPERVAVVVGPGMPDVEQEARRSALPIAIALQQERRGTADAVRMAEPALRAFSGPVLVVYGDTPLLRPASLAGLVRSIGEGAALAVLGFEASEPAGYGRLILDRAGRLSAIREEADASLAERAIGLCNSGVMAFAAPALWRLLARIGNDNAKGEFYLTDAVGLAVAAGERVAVARAEEHEVLGVNTAAELARAERFMQERLRAAAMAGGATLVAPETVFLSFDTTLGRDVVVEPHVVFGPGAQVGDRALIHSFSHIEGAVVAAGAQIGPFARLRPGTEIGAGARVGNFVEIKQASIEARAKVNHLTYIGDARVGEGANVGAGTITCNYDGFAKHFTDIGRGAFIGSNSSLVAPVRIGEGAYVGSGSVITRDVEPDALAMTRATLTQKPGWAGKRRAAKGSGQGSQKPRTG